MTDARDAEALKRFGIPSKGYAWGQFNERFDIAKEPNEPNRFGWVVEIDPFDPSSVPVKRTAMGRFKHEGAGNTINKDGRFVVYQGDDERFEYVYRFVTEGKVDLANPKANRDLLDKGTLSVARFNADGTGEWLPLVHGQGKLTAENRLQGSGRRGDPCAPRGGTFGATKMDRPEDVDVSPKTGKVYVILTLNEKRKTTGEKGADAANPRPNNRFGHIIEITPDGGDHAAANVPLGDPVEVRRSGNRRASARHSIRRRRRTAGSPTPTTARSTPQGRLWISTDGNSPKSARDARTAYGRSIRKAPRAARRDASIRCREGRSCAAPASRRTWRRCSSPCSTRRKARGRHRHDPLDLRSPLDALAGFQAQHAPAAERGGNYEEGWGEDWVVNGVGATRRRDHGRAARPSGRRVHRAGRRDRRDPGETQAKADASYFAAVCGRAVEAAEWRLIEAGFLEAYRWQYIHSGAQHPHFLKVLSSLITENQGQRIQAALATPQ